MFISKCEDAVEYSGGGLWSGELGPYMERVVDVRGCW